VWVTAQALTALAGRPFPLGRIPRAHPPARPQAQARGRPAPAPTAAPTPAATPAPSRRPKRHEAAPPVATAVPRPSSGADRAAALARQAGVLMGVALAVLW
jgi:hypothetical protein